MTMTTVPDNVREFWKQVYVLFDTHFRMDIHDADNWNKFWADAEKIYHLHENDIPKCELLLHSVAEMICNFSEGTEEN